MFHGFDYPDETGQKQLSVCFCRQVMKKGIITFEAPKDIAHKRIVWQYGEKFEFKKFENGVNFNELV